MPCHITVSITDSEKSSEKTGTEPELGIRDEVKSIPTVWPGPGACSCGEGGWKGGTTVRRESLEEALRLVGVSIR